MQLCLQIITLYTRYTAAPHMDVSIQVYSCAHQYTGIQVYTGIQYTPVYTPPLILGSFDFVVALFTPPVTAPVMLAAAHERLADLPHGAAPHRSVEDMLGFADNMLSGATWRSGRLR